MGGFVALYPFWNESHQILNPPFQYICTVGMTVLTPQASSTFIPDELSEHTGVTTQRTSNVLAAFVKRNSNALLPAYFFTKLGIT